MAFGDLLGTAFAGNAASITNPFSIGSGAGGTGSATVSVGDLVVAVLAQQTALTVTAVSDNLGNAYFPVDNGLDGGSQTGRAFWAVVEFAGTLNQINATTTASANDVAFVAAAFAGPFLGIALDAAPTQITSDITSPFTCPATGTLTQTDELVIAWGITPTNAAASWAATSPNVLVTGAATSTANISVVLGSQVVASINTVAPVFTAGANPAADNLGTASFRKATAADGFGGVKAAIGTYFASVANPTNLTTSVAVSVGDLVVVSYTIQDTVDHISTVTDNLGNGYAAFDNGNGNPQFFTRAFWSRISVDGTLTTISLNPSSTTTNDIAVCGIVYKGPFILPALDAHPAQVEDLTSPFAAPATGVLVQADELVVSWTGAGTAVAAWLAVAPNVLLSRVPGANATHMQSAQVVSATNSVTPNYSGANPIHDLLGTGSFRKETQPNPNAIFNGAGTLVANATVVSAGPTSWPAFATFNGAGALTANTTEGDVVNAAFGGAGAVTANTAGITFTAAAFGGAGSVSAKSSGITFTAGAFGGAGGLSVVTYYQALASGAYSGSGALTGYLAGFGIINAAYAGSGALTAPQTVELGAVTGQFLGAGTFAAPQTVELGAIVSAFAGSGTFTAPQTVEIGAVTATWAGAGLLFADATSQAAAGSIFATFAGAGGLTVFTYYEAIANGTYDGNGTLTSYLFGLDEISGVQSGNGTLSVSTIELGAINAAFAGAGGLVADATAISAQTISASFGGSGTLTAPQTIEIGAVNAAPSGAGLLTAPQTVQLGAIDATANGAGALNVFTYYQAVANGTYNGAGAVTGYLFGVDEVAAAFAGSGALSPRTIEIGAITAAFAGAGSLRADVTVVSQFGIFANFAGSGRLTAPQTRQLGAVNAQPVGAGRLTAPQTRQLGAVNAQPVGAGGLSVYTFYEALARGVYSGSGAAVGFSYGLDLVNTTWNGVGSFTGFSTIPTFILQANAAFFGQGLLRANALSLIRQRRPTVPVLVLDYRVGAVNATPLTYAATPTFNPPAPDEPLPGAVLNETCALILNLGFIPRNIIPTLSFVRPDGGTHVADPQFVYLGRNPVIQVSNTFHPGEYVVYQFAWGELNEIGIWQVNVQAGVYNYPTGYFTVVRSKSFPRGAPQGIPIRPPVGPFNAYVAEDGTTFYVAEDGTTFYVQES